MGCTLMSLTTSLQQKPNNERFDLKEEEKGESNRSNKVQLVKNRRLEINT